MHKQCYTLCCKNNCCKQENAQWTNFMGCKNYMKDLRNHPCNIGVNKGFVQNLKDKIINLQYDSPQIQFAKKNVKKKQKDYYCLMLRKINNLDKKLQNLEHLFISHLNHTPKEVFNSKDKEPLHDYMDFYDSVRSLVDVANRLKEDIIYKQYDNNLPNKNTLHLDDRIQVLDSELQNLYRHLEDLQNYTDNIKGRKQLYVKDHQDLPRIYSGYRRGPKNKSYKLKEVVCTPKKHNEDCRNTSSQCIECCYEADEDTPVSCHCSGCNISASLCPDNRRYKVVECCRGGFLSKDSDCSCVVCVSERKNGGKFRKKKLWISQSSSSCSCEMCISSNRKLCVQKHNSARIKIIKPVKKARNDDFFRELEISYHELEPDENDKKKNQKNKKKNKNLNENDPDVRVERTYYQDIGPTSNSMTVSRFKSGDSSNLEKASEKYSNKQQQKVHSPTYNQRKDGKNVVYYEVAPNLNIITKKRNKGQDIYSSQGNDRKARKNRNKQMSKKGESNRNSPNRMFAVNIEENDPLNEYFEKAATGKRTSLKYQNEQSSSDDENSINNYVTNKKLPTRQKNKNKSNGDTGRHLHIKIRQNKDLEEKVIVEGNVRSPENKNKYRKNQLQLYHRKHGGFCHITNGKDVKKLYFNRKYSKYFPYNGELSSSDSFETLEEYVSSSESCASQYKVFFCDDPNCVDKLDSDELIMLMNKTDMKYCGANPYKLSIHEDIKELKTDVCEKCTVKEKSITVTPRKTANKKINEKDKFILKKEVVECSKCKNKVNDKLSNIAITERNIKYVDSATRNEKFVTSNKSSNSESTGSDKQNPNQERAVKLNRSKTQKSNNVLAETDYQEQNDPNAVNNQTSDGGSKRKSTTALAYNEIGQKTAFKVSNPNNSPTQKPLELQGFGNLININIERGSYSVSQNPEMDSSGKGTAIEEKSLENKNINSDSKHMTGGVSSMKSTNLDKIGESVSRNAPSKLRASSFAQKNNPSISDLNLVLNNEREFKSVTLAKSEVFTNSPSILQNTSGSKMKNESKNKITTEIIVSYMEADNNNAVDGKVGKGVQPKSGNKNIPSNRANGEHLGNALNDLITSDNVYEEGYDNLSTNSMSALKKNVVRPKVSISKLKRSRLKNNKKFGPSLSKVSSVHSVIVRQAALYPDDNYPPKRPNVYNPMRRSTKQSKRKANIYPRIIPLMKENSLSGIIKPQNKDVEKECYNNNLKIPFNDSSNSRYKVASISNYLSSTVISESSYCTLNWETVANKLKEDDKYLNNIA